MKNHRQALLLALAMLLPATTALASFTDEKILPEASAARTTMTRSAIRKMGINPDTEQGQALARWMFRLSELEARNGKSGDTTALKLPRRLLHLTPQQRLSYLGVMKATLDMQPDGCDILLNLATGRNPASWFARSSVTQIDSLMQLLLTEADAASRSMPLAGNYTMAQMLEATVYANEQSKPLLARMFRDTSAAGAQPATLTENQKQCRLLRVPLTVIEQAPAELQERLTWDLVANTSNAGTTVLKILRAPEAYAIDTFDQPVLPAAIQARLPAAGSRPLPFKRIVVLAHLVSSKMPGLDEKLRYTFINVQNNGVILKIGQGAPKAGIWTRATFETDFGLLALKTQDVNGDMKSADFGMLPETAQGLIAHAFPEAGGHYDVPAPVPNTDNTTLQRCEAGKQYEASTIHPALTGKALDIHCIEYSNETIQDRVHFAYLVDYGVELQRAIWDEKDGDITTAIDSIEID